MPSERSLRSENRKKVDTSSAESYELETEDCAEDVEHRVHMTHTDRRTVPP